MKCIMVAVVSKDEFLTKGNDPNPKNWTSKEDHVFFANMKSKYGLFVMGSTTYESGYVKPSKIKRQIILTHSPEKYAMETVEEQLEFKNLSPQQFIDAYKNEYDRCLVLGGSRVYTDFLEAGLLSEIYLTVEPVINKRGVSLFSNKKISDFSLPEPKTTILNDNGTELRHYVLD